MPALRILAVDDHEDSARAVAMLLRRAGHEVTTAHTLAGALALGTGSAAPDLLLCDIDLPDGDGCELLRRLRAYYRGTELAGGDFRTRRLVGGAVQGSRLPAAPHLTQSNSTG